jgi:pimeloyl-ACP methyl ester carboxylesterase
VPERIGITAAGRALDIEYAWVGPHGGDTMVFLHEGLGSLAMWRDYPRKLCEAIAMRGLVFSRPGYGASTPRGRDEKWGADFMHAQARDVLPALLAGLRVAPRPWLFGHSDGASIALLYAAMLPQAPAGVIALAPHLFVEDVSVQSIAAARVTYETAGLRERLAKYHADADSAFYGWNDAWLAPAFRGWNIEREMRGIRCPVLAVQGEEDEYGTMAQIDALAALIPQAKLVKLAHCGHSPHRDQPQALTRAVAQFLAAQTSEVK